MNGPGAPVTTQLSLWTPAPGSSSVPARYGRLSHKISAGTPGRAAQPYPKGQLREGCPCSGKVDMSL